MYLEIFKRNPLAFKCQNPPNYEFIGGRRAIDFTLATTLPVYVKCFLTNFDGVAFNLYATELPDYAYLPLCT